MCSQLKSVHIGVEVHLDYDLSEINLVYWRRCLEVLKNTQPTVRSVTISVLTWAVSDTSYFEPLALLDWDMLERYLSRYKQLERVSVRISSRNIAPWILDVEEMQTRLAAKFSAKHQCMLNVVFGASDDMGW